MSIIFNSRIINLFESFYRYGYLVIGGGQVVIPLMYSELVEIKGIKMSLKGITAVAED